MAKRRRNTPTQGTNPPMPANATANPARTTHAFKPYSGFEQTPNALCETCGHVSEAEIHQASQQLDATPFVADDLPEVDVILEPSSFVAGNGHLTGDGRDALVAVIDDVRVILDGLPHRANDGAMCPQSLLVLDKCKTCTRVIEVLGVLRHA